MKQFCVYILKCIDDSYYAGITSNLKKRMSEHLMAADPGCYTAKRLPVKLVFVRYYRTALEAINFEKQLKGWSRKKKEALINGDIAGLKDLASCKNSTSHLRLRQ